MAATAAVRPFTAPGAAAETSPFIRGDFDDRHLIRAGDKLSFRIDEDKEDPRVLTVTDSGEIELPYNLGRFIATNRTCKTLAQEIKAAVEQNYYKRATVHVGLETMNTVAGKVYVQGQVTKPGPVTIPSDSKLMLSQALLAVGPPLQWADLKTVRIVRGTGGSAKTFMRNVREFDQGKMDQDMALEPEDWVFVGERGIKFGN